MHVQRLYRLSDDEYAVLLRTSAAASATLQALGW
jgi:hypothetical protein